MPRFTPVICVKEKAIPAFTKDRWHPTSLADEASDAKTLSTISYLPRRGLATAGHRLINSVKERGSHGALRSQLSTIG
jgi:hypothetical protein